MRHVVTVSVTKCSIRPNESLNFIQAGIILKGMGNVESKQIDERILTLDYFVAYCHVEG
jgi:hypothetical protein